MSSSPKMQTKKSLLNQLNKELVKLDGKPLQEWLKAAAEIIQTEDGIYCGREGSIKEQILGVPHEIWLTMGWYTVDKIPKVEYAYLS